uniref:MD-2-related lipid-recognition domain-containing protein n=1 Tax=Anopheles maculatus TaxID=74869 RepID=A0A182TCR2_9DIPT
MVRLTLVIIIIYTCLTVYHTNVAGATLKLIPVVTKADIEGSRYVNASAIIRRQGSIQDFNMDILLHVLLPLDDIRMNIGYSVRTRNSESRIYNKTIDFCSLLERPSIDRFGSLLIDDLRHHGIVPNRCPVQPKLIVFRNVTLTRVKLPGFLPETSFGFSVICFKGSKYEHVFRSYWYGRLRKVMIRK